MTVKHGYCHSLDSNGGYNEVDCEVCHQKIDQDKRHEPSNIFGIRQRTYLFIKH